MESKELGRRLKAAVRRSRVSQRYICRELNITTSTMQNYLNGRTVPDAITLHEICLHIGTSMDYLFGSGKTFKISQALVDIEEKIKDLRKGLKG